MSAHRISTATQQAGTKAMSNGAKSARPMEKAKKKKKVGSGTGKKDMAKSHAVHERLEAPGEKVGGKGAAGKNGPKGKGTSAPFKAGKKPKK